MNKIKNIYIIGMGALGILFGHQIQKYSIDVRVNFIGDEARVRKYRQEGVYYNGERCTFNMITPDEISAPADLVIVCVKWPGLRKALESIKKGIGKDTIVISLLNGISSEEVIKDVFNCGHVVYTVAQGMDATKIGNKLVCANPGEIRIGLKEMTRGSKEDFDRVVELFKQSNVPYTIDENIIRRMWGKWMVNVGLNQVVMVYEGTYKTIQTPGSARNMMQGAMREVIELSKAIGINLTEDDLKYYVDINDNLDPNGMPSMRQDGLLKRPSEVEMFSGTVIDMAKKYGINVPINEELNRRVKEIEEKY